MSIEINVVLPGLSGGPEVHHVSIVRLGVVPPNGVSTYKVLLDDHLLTRFRHRYDDGWVACVARAMAQLDHRRVVDSR